jgi:hypothetical protein
MSRRRLAGLGAEVGEQIVRLDVERDISGVVVVDEVERGLTLSLRLSAGKRRVRGAASSRSRSCLER